MYQTLNYNFPRENKREKISDKIKLHLHIMLLKASLYFIHQNRPQDITVPASLFYGAPNKIAKY